jgi:thiosulfate/3-mercaptopyruvate sulfurtransferase
LVSTAALWLGICGLIALVGGCQTPAASPTDADAPPVAALHHEADPLILGPARLAERLEEHPAPVLLHVGHGRWGYDRGHLPGAHYVDFREVMVDRDGLRVEAPARQDLIDLLEQRGARPDSAVVLYGDAAGVFPARLYVALAHHGLAERVFLLDGHLRGWRDTGRPLETSPQHPDETGQVATEADAPGQTLADRTTPPALPIVPRPAGPIAAWPNAASGAASPVVVDRTFVESALAAGAEPKAVVLDVRPTDQFEGEKRGTLRGRGHIPGAVSLPWRELLTGINPPWLIEEDRRLARLAEVGIRPAAEGGGTVIVYDAVGLQSALVYTILKDLGVAAVLYDGGFEDWLER